MFWIIVTVTVTGILFYLVVLSIMLMRKTSQNSEVKSDRYQFQPFYIKLLRRIRYQPEYFIRGLLCATKNKFFTKRTDKKKEQGHFRLVFSVVYTEWQYKAKYYYCKEEVESYLRDLISKVEKERLSK